MATRQETNRRREALRKFLREAGRRHAGAPVPAPPVRELALQHELSSNLVCSVLQELTVEGVLHTVPRVGTFIGAPRLAHETSLLLLTNDRDRDLHHRQMRVGFEDRIAARGGSVLTLEYSAALAHFAARDLPELSGVFDLAYLPYGKRAWSRDASDASTPRVRFATHEDDTLGYDLVCFDDEDGARQATRHLLDLGHTRIAFLALHSTRHDSGRLEWSSQRENGWRETLVENGLAHRGLAFHPDRDPKSMSGADEARSARQAARALLESAEVSAVVAANDHAAHGLLQELKAARVPHEKWPAIVGFDGQSGLSQNMVTSLRLPWEEIGREAADLIWERGAGVLASPPVLRKVPMRLISRMTSRRDWMSSSVGVAHAVLA